MAVMNANSTYSAKIRQLRQKLRIKSSLIRVFLSEFIGTFFLMAFVLGCIAQTTFGARTEEGYGGYFGGYLGGGFGVSFGMYASLTTSGGHVNPAISLAAAIIGMTKWSWVPFLWLGQYLGSFAAAASIYGVYNDALNNYDGGVRSITGPNATAGIFATYPKDYVSIATALGEGVLTTVLLVFGALSVLDPKNNKSEPYMVPLGVGLCVMAITFSFNMNISTAINPARDLSPRIFTAIAGWGNGVFSYKDYKWFWIPIVGPHIGAIVGALLYELLIDAHHPETEELDIVQPKEAGRYVGYEEELKIQNDILPKFSTISRTPH